MRGWKLLGFLGVLCLCGSIASADSQSTAGKTDAKTGSLDPVARAFALPKGTVLSAQQKRAYDKLKTENAPALRSAIDQTKSASSSADQTKYAKQAAQIRTKVRAGIKQILAMTQIATGQQSPAGYMRPASARPGMSGQSASGACPCGR
ncbi:MAG: hypothetical protein ABSG68_02115 [Thermoguttaceae bacterium]|jgi:hypothetical protein